MTDVGTRRSRRRRPRRGRVRHPGVGGAILFGIVLLTLFLALAFAAGYGIGKLLI